MTLDQREVRWVIVGRIGLYTGQWRRRCDAIETHVCDLFTYPQRPTPAEVRRYWQKCRRKGDRCIQAEILWSKE